MGSSRWLFEDWPEGSLFRTGQVLHTAMLRLFVTTTLPVVRLMRKLL